MTAEQLATNALLLKLPEELANTFRNGLRLKRQGKGQDDFKFSPDEFRDVMNDTVMTWSTTAPIKAAATTVSQTSAQRSSEVQNRRIEVKSTHDIRTSNGNTRGGARGGFRGRGNFNNKSFGRGGNRQFQNAKPTCQVCQEQTHFTNQCTKYPDPQSKRAKLLERGVCQNCARAKHEGRCKLRGTCYLCNGEHLAYLCPNVKPDTIK